MPIPIDELRIVVKQDTTGVKEGLQNVADGLVAIRNASKGSVGNNIEKISGQLNTLITAVSRIPMGAGQALGNLGTGLAGVANVARTNGNRAYDNLCKIGLGILDLNDVIREIPDVSRLERLANALEKLKNLGALKTVIPKATTKSLAKAVDAVKGVENGKFWGNGSNAGGTPGKLPSAEAEKQAKKLTGLTDKFKKLMASIGRIALYRAIRAVLKTIIQSFEEGLKNIYAYSKNIGTEFYKIRDNIATSATYLKNALGAASSQIIALFAPAVTTLLDGVAELFNKIAETIAALRGEDMFTKAIKGTVQWNEELGKVKRTLLGFDEINKLNGNNGTSGDAYSAFFTEAKVSKELADGQFVSTVRDIFDMFAKIKDTISGNLKNTDWSGFKNLMEAIADSIKLGLEILLPILSGTNWTVALNAVADLLAATIKFSDAILRAALGEVGLEALCAFLDFIAALIGIVAGVGSIPLNCLAALMDALAGRTSWSDFASTMGGAGSALLQTLVTGLTNLEDSISRVLVKLGIIARKLPEPDDPGDLPYQPTPSNIPSGGMVTAYANKWNTILGTGGAQKDTTVNLVIDGEVIAKAVRTADGEWVNRNGRRSMQRNF